MQRYVVRRLLWLVVVLLAISLITFALMHAVPGGPWDQEKPMSDLDPGLVAKLNQKYGLDKPLWEQYGIFLWNALQGDLGLSYTQGGTISAYAMLVYAIMQIPAGYMADRFGLKKVFFIGVLGTAVLCFSFGLVSTYSHALLN